MSEKPITNTPSVFSLTPTLLPPGYNFKSSTFCTETVFTGIKPNKSKFIL